MTISHITYFLFKFQSRKKYRVITPNMHIPLIKTLNQSTLNSGSNVFV
jgi:hypothetical protein